MSDTLNGEARDHRSRRIREHRERRAFFAHNGTRLRGLTPEDAEAHTAPIPPTPVLVKAPTPTPTPVDGPRIVAIAKAEARVAREEERRRAALDAAEQAGRHLRDVNGALKAARIALHEARFR